MKKILLLFLALFCALTVSAGNYLVTINPSSPYPGESAVVAYSTPSGANTWQDYIGIYPQGKPAEVSVLWRITSSTPTNYKAFTFVSPGNYSLQYFDNSGFAYSAPVDFTVQTGPGAYSVEVTPTNTPFGTQVEIVWQSAPNLDITGDLIGYASSTSPGVIIASFPVEGHSGVAYRTMTTPGVYDFGYYKTSSGSRILVSALARVIVTDTPFSLTMKKSGTKMVLSWPSSSGATYEVLSSANVSASIQSWSVVKTLSGSGSTLSYTNASPKTREFFQVRKSWP